jgi:hypothetical protein
VKLNESRKALEKLFEDESDEDEGKIQQVMMAALKRRRLTIAGIMSTVSIETPPNGE